MEKIGFDSGFGVFYTYICDEFGCVISIAKLRHDYFSFHWRKVLMRILKEEKAHINVSYYISETVIQWIMMIIWGKSSGGNTI